jgi:GNAT superfamily N-acetyltransferase
MIDIRRAVPDDARRLAGLRWEFRSAKTTPVEPEAEFVARCADWMRDAIATGVWHVWVAVDGTTIVGQVWTHLIPKLPNPALEREHHLYISNVFVTPSARGGVGTRLLDAALAFATAERVDRVILWPSSRSRAMYQRRGFAPRDHLFELELSGSGESRTLLPDR